jgi:hypothetical protein
VGASAGSQTAYDDTMQPSVHLPGSQVERALCAGRQQQQKLQVVER